MRTRCRRTETATTLVERNSARKCILANNAEIAERLIRPIPDIFVMLRNRLRGIPKSALRQLAQSDERKNLIIMAHRTY